MKTSLRLMLAAALAALYLSPVQAQVRVHVGLGYGGFGPGYYRPWRPAYYGPPVVVGPPPVVVAPPPAYYGPAPVMVAPPPVYVMRARHRVWHRGWRRW